MTKHVKQILLLWCLLLGSAAQAANTDISSSPLEVGGTGVVQPNVMLLFDDSGSMAWDYMPDWLSGNFATYCVNKPYINNGNGNGSSQSTNPCPTPSGTSTIGEPGDPPYYAYRVNGIYYNPNQYYQTPVDTVGLQWPATGAKYPSYTTWTAVPSNPYSSLTSNTINLTTSYPENTYCSASQSSYSSTNCKRNGIDTGNPFLYNYDSASPPHGYPDATATISGTTVTVSKGTYEYPVTLKSNPYYFDIQPYEYCSDTTLINCQVGSGGAYVYPAYVRYCVLQSDQISPNAVSGTAVLSTGGSSSPRCQSKYNLALGYTLPRYGMFYRNDIVPGNTSYTRSSTRSDCGKPVAPATTVTCTYAQEMTNFANWYAYYRTRIQMAKTAVGLAFNSLTSSYRVGMLTINAYSNGNLDTSKFLPIGTYNAAQKTSFYRTFYGLSANNSTPLREALSRVGWYYAGKTTGLSSGMITSSYPDPVQYSCQQNFVIMTTDGYWNGNGGSDLNGNAIGQVDNNLTNPYVYRAPTPSLGNAAFGPGGYYDGNLADTSSRSNSGGNGGNGGNGSSSTYTSSATLADTAMYYYSTDLRPAGSKNYNTGISVSTDDNGNAQVPTAPGVDMNTKQHMVTYTIGLGVDGYLTYDSGGTYGSADFLKIVNGATGCTWAPNSVCNWPQVPAGSGFGDDPSKDDDLWHAAVNGRGYYLSAKNPTAFYFGLTNDLALITQQTGAAAAVATSTPNITQTNNAIYDTNFQTASWTGQLQAQTINVSTGIVSSAVTWSAQAALDAQASATTDSRTIYTSTGGVSPTLVSFDASKLDATALAWFTNLCTANGWTQCSTLTGSDLALVNTPANLISYLRGQSQYADNIHFRQRSHVLGDLVDSRPVSEGLPLRNYADTPKAPANQTYASWAMSSAVANRQPTVFVGGNDGMLHAFNSNTGAEMWAYAPRMLLSNLYKLADFSYATQHRFYVDGSPSLGEVMDGNGYWHTILVEGMGAGGSGYVALDVTDPTKPSLLWEFCNDSTLCGKSDANLGLSFGNPVITKRAYDGKWVVLLTSGYNNDSNTGGTGSGTGVGTLFELDALTGTELRSVSTGVGSATTPAGLGRITAKVNSPSTDNTATVAYAGDLLGNLWRFDLTQDPPVVTQMASLKDASGNAQPITTRPEVGVVNNNVVVYVATGKLLGASDLGSGGATNSIYGLVDTGKNLGNPRADSTVVRQTLSGTVTLTVSANAVAMPVNHGWYIDFITAGERVNVDPQLALGTLLVTSNIPTASPCSAGGSSYEYQLNYASGGAINGISAVATENTSAMTVGNIIEQLPSGAVKVISTLASGSQVTSGLNTGGTANTLRHVNWRVVPR